MNKLTIKIFVFFLGLTLLVFGVSFAQPRYNISWTPSKIETTVERGDVTQLDVTFVSDRGLTDVNLWTVPELQPYITVTPDHFDTIDPGVPNYVQLVFSATCENIVGSYDGTIHLRSHDKTFPQTLKIKLQVDNPDPSGTHITDFPTANPDAIFTQTEATVSISLQIVPDPALLPEDIRLLRLDDVGQVIADLGRMYDDATHGDQLPGDSTFTTQLNFMESVPGQITLIVSVPYSDVTCSILSEPIIIDVIDPPNENEVNEILSVNEQATLHIENWTKQYGTDAARNMLLEYLLTQSAVADAGISQDGETIWIVYSNGLEGVMPVKFPDTWGYPSSNKALVLTTDSNMGESDVTYVYGKLDSDSCVSLDPIRRDGQVTVNFMKTISQYGVIFIAAHGNIDGYGDVIFQTGEKATSFMGIPTSHLIDWITKKIVIGPGNIWHIKPKFIRHYAANRHYPNSIVFLTMCHSLDNNTLSDAFISRGVATVFGWVHSVSVTFARQTIQNILVQMTDNDLPTGAAFAAVPKIDPYSTPNAVYTMHGRVDMKLPVNLVTNGSFETGDLSGWNAGFEYGCDFPFYGTPSGYRTVISGNATDETYSARLGRWDQIYTGGLYGPPEPGSEPCGYDYVYQDVDIPSGSSLNLSFSYNIQSYDTAEWDWFDVYIKDPNTGTNLATVVFHDGEPGLAYGDYYNGGIENVTFGLGAFAGQTIRIWFGNRQDGWGDQNAVWIDNVIIGCQ